MSPRFLVTFNMRFGIDSYNELKYSIVISFFQISEMVLRNSKVFVARFFPNFIFRCAQKFSIGFRSGLFPGHSSNFMPILFFNSVIYK